MCSNSTGVRLDAVPPAADGFRQNSRRRFNPLSFLYKRQAHITDSVGHIAYAAPILVRAVPVRTAVLYQANVFVCDTKLVCTPMRVCRNDDNVLPGFIEEALFPLALPPPRRRKQAPLVEGHYEA